MTIEYVRQGSLHYVKMNGVVGSKGSVTQQKAELYADRVVKGLARFETLASNSVKLMQSVKDLRN
jgi:hypothetical protein